jgi:hypothetical protein
MNCSNMVIMMGFSIASGRSKSATAHMSTAELAHPITTDPNFDDVLRVIDSLLFGAKHKVARQPATLVAVLASALCNVGSAATGKRIRFLRLQTRSEERITNINGRNHHPLTCGRFLT